MRKDALVRTIASTYAFLSLSVLCLGCSKTEEQVFADRSSDREIVRVAHSSLKTIRPVLETFGTLVYHSKADIYPGIDGTIEQVYVEEGEKVSKGQALARFSKEKLLTNRDQIEAEVASKEALLALAQERLREGRNAVEARMLEIQKAQSEQTQAQVEFDNISQIYSNKKRLFEAGGVSEGELQSLYTRFMAAQMGLSRAQKELEIRRIGFRDEDIRAAGLPIPTDEISRRKTLIDINTGILSAELRVAQAEYDATRAELRRIVMMLNDTVVQSPIGGIVGMRFVETGEKADRETLLFTIFNTDSVYAQIEVAESDLQLLQLGQEAEFRFNEKSQTNATGRLQLISPYINPKTRTARIRINIDNPSGTFIPGMFVQVRIFTGDRQEKVVIPQSAAVEDTNVLHPGKALVYVVRDSRLFRREVTLGQREGDWIVAEEGLEAGEAVVLDASIELRDGTEVEVLP
jgi:RND family efflux transporter MFP subunit